MPRSGSCLPVLAVASAWLLNQHAGDQVLGHAGQPGNKVDHRVRQPRILVKAARGSRLGGRTARAWWASDVTLRQHTADGSPSGLHRAERSGLVGPGRFERDLSERRSGGGLPVSGRTGPVLRTGITDACSRVPPVVACHLPGLIAGFAHPGRLCRAGLVAMGKSAAPGPFSHLAPCCGFRAVRGGSGPLGACAALVRDDIYRLALGEPRAGGERLIELGGAQLLADLGYQLFL